MSSKPFFLAVSVVVLVVSSAWGADADWKPAEGPLKTRWAKEVRPDRVLPEYPRPQLRREAWQNLNGVWQLAFAREGDAAPVGKDLPERILVPFPVESALSGVMKPAERLWYRRLFSVPKGWSGRRILLHFGAVDWEATVHVNGKKVGEHRGGYDPFSFDITDALSDKKDQELIVGVWDPTDAGPQPRGKQVRKPGGIYYTPVTGIWQSVWLEAVNAPGHITRLNVETDIDRNEVTVGVELSQTLGNSRCDVEVLDGDKVIAKAGGLEGRFTIKVPDAKHWTPDTPHLYGLRVHVSGMKAESGSDQVESYFGMRKISVGKDGKGTTRILLNGKFVFQRGPLDQGFWPDGIYTAPTDEALKFDIEMTKKLGFNMTRKHVKVEPDRWYYWCDRLGLLVWQDMPSGDRSIRNTDPDLKRSPESARIYETELRRMIDGLHNHPCIVMWVIFNEGWGQFDTARMAEWTKKHDPTRLVDSASGWTDRGVGDVHDIHVYPGPGSPEPEPKRAAVLGEFGGLGLGVDGHTWSKKTWGYRGTASKADLTRKYEELWRRTWKLRDDRGLSAAVYTQITDVETEANGLLTYDREIVKVDEERAAAAAAGDFSRAPEAVTVVPTSREKGQTWRYTLTRPAEGWFKPGFKDSDWKEAVGGFGTTGTPGAVVRTEWKTDDIWLRREFELLEVEFSDLRLLLHHDEDADVYLNGVLAVHVAGYITDYEEFPISAEARAALKKGKNTLAVTCHQTKGGQYIDVGLIDLKRGKK
jgi:hypothetical protein